MAKSTTPAKPVWTLDDGITFSLLSKFIICRHRFWVRTILGYREDIGFDYKVEYGNLMHAGFEAYAAATKQTTGPRIKSAQTGIRAYADDLKKRATTGDMEDIEFWTTIVIDQFDAYARHYEATDASKRYVAQEQVFDVQIPLPSGRSIRVRGKLDEVFHQRIKHKGKWVDGPLTLQENKVKGFVDEDGLVMALHNDLQTMMYVDALGRMPAFEKTPCFNVLYNVLRRPLAGGIGNAIVQRKGRGKAKTGAETRMEFAERVKTLYRPKAIEGSDEDADPPIKFFLRYPVELSPSDLTKFRYQVYFPLLEQVCDWWESIAADPFNPWKTSRSHADMEQDAPGFSFTTKPNPLHYMRPFGIWDGMADGMRGDYFNFITHGERTGLTKLTTAFPELENASLSNR